MKTAALAALALTTLATPALAEDYGAARDLGAWLDSHAEDAQWLAEGTERAPRAWIDQTDHLVTVIIKLPEQVTADSIVQTVMNYDVSLRTDDVETAFQVDGAFFTGTKVLSFFSPTVTANKVDKRGGTLNLSWRLMSEDASAAWIDKHHAELGKALAAVGLDHDPDDVADYAKKIKKRLDVVETVVGSHQYWGGYYRYTQDLSMASLLVDAAARKLGRARQYKAALKAACYSTGMHAWAGAAGQEGVVFEARGNAEDKVRPGK